MRVLLVEDSRRLRTTLTTALRRSGYAVDDAGDGQAGLELATANDYDAIVLDIMLPGLSGLELLKHLRERGSSTHILLLTAKDTVDDRVRGLQAGADDYLVKPFALEELLARVEALCRRAYGSKQTRLVIADLEIDTVSKQVLRAGQPMVLKPREYLLLLYLARRSGQVVTRREIEDHLYNGEIALMSNAVESAISSLRKKLSRANPAPLIHTRHGLGYVLKTETE